MAESSLEAANKEAKERLIRSLRGKGAHLSFDEAVHDFPDELMNTEPPNVPYTFWHQLEHIRICQWDILMYVVDPNHDSPSWPQGYWPDKNATADRTEWDKSIAGYHADLQELIALIQRPECRVLEPVEHNAGRSIMGSALIVIDHSSYHVGEFVMGRQILGAWKSALA
jgi:hypothetical protein